ncbi:MAG TPA: hypothetical protein VJ963_05560 [Bacteroidales bacterium]|nr:hypothetical protein [Bacteroidales bacterium]
MKRLILGVIILTAVLSGVDAQNVSVTSSFDSTRIYLGDQINYTVTVNQPAGQQLMIPVLKDSLCNKVDILAGPAVDTVKGTDGNIKVIQKYLVTSYDSGFYQVPPVYAEIKTGEGVKRFYSDYARLRVMRVKISPPDTTAKIFDIVGPYKAPLTLGEVLPWILLALVIGALTWYLIRYIKKRRASVEGYAPVVNPDPAHVIAFRELEKLRDEKLWQQGEVKAYYTRMTEILRQYLEDRYRVYSLELTTEETLGKLLKTGFRKDDTYNLLKMVLTGADLVKFAKHKPEPSENDSHFQQAWDFVDATKYVPADVPQENKDNVEKEDRS